MKADTEGQKKIAPPSDIVVGRQAVTEALKSQRGVNRLYVATKDNAVGAIIALAKERGVAVDFVSRERLTAKVGGLNHQGVLASVAPVSYVEPEEILQRAAEKGEPPFILILDELSDPHNLGALLRTAEAVGLHGVLIPKRHTVPLTATVAKTSAGAVEYVPVARIGNIAQAMQELKKQGLWIAGADMDGEQELYAADFTCPLALVIGSEGKGLGRLVKETCDFLVRIPMLGKINSLNASVAGSLLMYEVLRQRRLAGRQS
ncbi:MAG: 23S rRNA (guanosine(2251)-2'-O)-methyltransferase RlmB [Selenomonadaceae bacterium]|nr:23S rRNA (guanosine(2251)-2'-O)-methyltransferase RlmB [Selenomonadaceae bacterium]